MKRERGVGTRGRGTNWRLALAAAAGATPMVAGLLPTGGAWGATKTFSATGTDWSVPANWTPIGVPTADDDALIDSGSADISLTGTSASIGSITFSSPAARRLGNATSGSANSLLTLSSTGTAPTISVLGGMFTIAGANIGSTGTGSGTLGVRLLNTATVINNGKIAISAPMSEGSTPAGLTLSGTGELELSAANDWTGGLEIGGQAALKVSGPAGKCAAVYIKITQDARLILDNSLGDNTNRINDAATITMDGGSIEMIGSGSPTGSFENIGTVRPNSGAITIGGHNPLNRPAILNFTCQFTDGRYTLDYALANGTHVTLNNPPALENGIIGPDQTVNGTDWATVSPGGEVVAYSGYNTNPDPLTWSSTDNVAIGVPSVTISADKEVNTTKTYLVGDSTIYNNAVYRTGGFLNANSGSIQGTGTLTARANDGKKIRDWIKNSYDSFTISVPITDNSDGAISLIKSGLGTLVLDAPNTLTGDVYVNQGTLKLTAHGQLFDPCLIQAPDGVTDTTFALSKSIGGLSGSGTVLLGAGTLSVGSNNQSTVYTGSIISSGGGGAGGGSGGSVRKVGEGTLELLGTNQFGDFHASNGRTRIDQLESVLKNTGILAFGTPVTPGVVEYTGADDTATRNVYVSTGGGTLQHGGNISMTGVISGPGDFTKAGSGTLTLTGANTMTGALAVSDGTVLLAGGGSVAHVGTIVVSGAGRFQFPVDPTDRLGASTNVVMAGGTFEAIGGASPITKNVGLLISEVSGQGAVKAGALAGQEAAQSASIIRTTVLPGGNAGTIRFTGADFEGRAGGTIDFAPATPTGISFVSPPALSNGIIGVFATYNSADWATISGADHHVAAYTNYNVNPNSATWGPNDNVAANIPAVINGNTTIGSLKLNSVPLTINGSSFLSTRGIIATGSSSITGTGTLTAPPDTDELIIQAPPSGGICHVSVPIGDNGRALNVITNGVLSLDAVNTFTGSLNVRSFGPRLSTANQIKQVTVRIAAGASLDLNGTDQTIGALSGDGQVMLGSGGGGAGGALGTLTIDQDTDSVFNLMTGDGNVIKRGAGTLSLTGDSTYTGETFIQQGALELIDDATLSGSPVVHVQGGAAIYIRMLTAQREATTKARNVAHGVLKAKRIQTQGIIQASSPPGPAPASVNIGELTFEAGHSTVRSSADLNFDVLSSRDPRSTVTFEPYGNGSIGFNNPPPLTNGIIGGYAVYRGREELSDFVTLDADGKVKACLGYVDQPSSWDAFTNGRYILKAGVPLRFDTNSLNYVGDGTPSKLTLAAGTSTITSGGLLFNAASGSTIEGPGSLTSGGSELFIAVPDRPRTKLVTVSGSITNNTLGSVGLIKSGEGTLVLSGNNTFTGPAVINEGTLELRGPQPLGGGILIHHDATLRLTDGVSLGAGHAITLIDEGNPDDAGKPTIDVPTGASASVSVGINEPLPYATLHKTGGGTLNLGGISTYTGGTVVNAGKIVNKGIIRGTVIINSGNFTIDPTSPPPGLPGGQLDDDATITMNGGTFTVAGSPPSVGTEIVGKLELASASNTVECACNHLRFASLSHSDPTATLNVIQTVLSPDVDLAFTSPPVTTNGIMGSWATFNSTDWATIQQGTGKVVAYTDYETSPNSLVWSPKSNVLLYGDTSLSTAKQVNTIKMSSGVHLTLTGQNFLSTAGIIAAGAGSIEGSGTLTAPAGTPLVIHAHGTGGSMRIDTPITDNGAPLTVIKDGDGTVELRHPGTYTGPTKLTRGVLKTFFQTGDKPTQSQFATMLDSTLDVSSGDQSLGSLSGAGSVVLGSSMLTLGSNNDSTTFSGVMSGNGGLTKAGDGAMTLTGIHIYTGGTIVRGGLLVLDGDGSIQSTAPISLQSGGALELQYLSPPKNVKVNASELKLEGGQLEVKFGTGLGRTDVTNVSLLHASSGSNTVSVASPLDGGGTVAFSALSCDAGSIVHFEFEGGGSGLRFTSPPALSNGIIGPWATVNSLDWATIAGDDHHVAPFHAYQTNPDPASWSATDNVSLEGSATISGDVSINTLRKGGMVNGAININSGSALRTCGILVTAEGQEIDTGNGFATAPVGTHHFGVIVAGEGNNFTLSGHLADNGSPVSLLKSGAGTLTLLGPSSYTGETIINEGTIAATSPDCFGPAGPNNKVLLNNGSVKFLSVWGSTHATPMIIQSGGGTIDTNGFSATLGKISGTGALTVTGAGTVTTPQIEQHSRLGPTNGGVERPGSGDALTIAGATLQVSPGSGQSPASLASGLSITGGGKLDVTNNKLIIRNTPLTLTGADFSSVNGMIVSGRNGGSWTGSGIITSQTQAHNSSYTSLAVSTAEDAHRVGLTFGGQTVEAGDVLVMYTYGGDATLDGKINIDDYVRIDSGLAGGYTGWSNGDFNYDGKVSIDDYITVIDANIGNQGPPFPSASGGGGGVSGVAAVPEPAGLSIVLAPVAAALFQRRRRRQ